MAMRRAVLTIAAVWCALACLVATAALIAGSLADDTQERAA